MISEKDILFEDNHLLVINKRAGIATMGVEAGEPSLLNEAKAYLKLKYNKPGNVFLGVVSRIDARVSGAIVFARTSKSASRLSEQFRNRTTEKIYWAIVPASSRRKQELDEIGKSTTLVDWMYKDEPAMRMRCCANEAMAKKFNAKRAELTFRPIGKFNDLRLLEIQLETGRKHQIRCQFAKFGSSILGDRKYGSSVSFSGQDSQAIALHSRTLKIAHPTQKTPLHFEAEVPTQWKVGRFGNII